MPRPPRIRKHLADLAVAPNLTDYAAECRSLIQFRFDPEHWIGDRLARLVDGLRNWKCIWGAGFYVFFNGLSAALAPPPLVGNGVDQAQARLRYGIGISFSHAALRACAACRSLCW